MGMKVENRLVSLISTNNHLKECCLHDLLYFHIGWFRRYDYRAIKSRKMVLRCRNEFTRPRARNATASRGSGTANFWRRIKTREKWSMQIYSGERAQSLKVLRIEPSGRLVVAEREVGCWRMEKRQTCICTGKLNIHVVQIRPPSDSFYRLLLL